MGRNVSNLLNCFCRKVGIYQRYGGCCFLTRTFDVLYYTCALGGLIAGKVRGVSLKPVWCLPLVLFMAELEAVSDIKNRCA